MHKVVICNFFTAPVTTQEECHKHYIHIRTLVPGEEQILPRQSATFLGEIMSAVIIHWCAYKRTDSQGYVHLSLTNFKGSTLDKIQFIAPCSPGCRLIWYAYSPYVLWAMVLHTQYIIHLAWHGRVDHDHYVGSLSPALPLSPWLQLSVLDVMQSIDGYLALRAPDWWS